MNGRSSKVHRRFGFFPIMNAAETPNCALVAAERVVFHRLKREPGKVGKFAFALDIYIEHAREQAKKKEKPPSWAATIGYIKRTHLKEFLDWTLSDLAASPLVVAAWHRRISESSGPSIADQSARVLKTVYRRAVQANRSLRSCDPTSAIQFNTKCRSQNVLALADLPRWFSAWQEIESPIRKAFQMINLLTGNRPRELSRLKWSDVLTRERYFLIRAPKAENNICVPMSPAIAQEFKRARNAARDDKIECEWVFPMRSGGHITRFDCDCLPAWGMAFRTIWRTVAADCGVNEIIAHCCLGHIPIGMSRECIAHLNSSSRSEMRAAQGLVSRQMLALMKGGSLV